MNQILTPHAITYEQRKMKIFNRLNWLGLLTGLFLPLAGLYNNNSLPPVAWLVAASPAIISSLVIWLNTTGRKSHALMVYFTLYPLLSSLVYAADMDLGIELFFILYAVLSVFYLPRIGQAVFCGCISALSYLVVYVLKKDYTLHLSTFNYPFYVFNHLLAMFFIFLCAISYQKRE